MAISPTGVPKCSFLSTRELNLVSPNPRKSRAHRCFKSPVAGSFDHIPKQFRQENLREGLMQNYKNVPEFLYGLTPSQMNMFMTEDNPFHRQSEAVKVESLSSAWSYRNNLGMGSIPDVSGAFSSAYTMSSKSNMRMGGRARTAPPDLPSLLLDSRIVYLGMPLVSAVTELILAELMYLDYDNPSKPIHLYIHSSGSQNDEKEIVAAETEAYAIADAMHYCKADVYTLNMGMALGQAAMLLSLGTKGFRGTLSHAVARIYLPKVPRSSGCATDLWIKAKDLDSDTKNYVEFLAKGTGKSEEEIYEDARETKFFIGESAIEYGLVDKVVTSLDGYDRSKYEERVTQASAMAKIRGTDGRQTAPSGGSRR